MLEGAVPVNKGGGAEISKNHAFNKTQHSILPYKKSFIISTERK